jgi:hypothetical protein
MSDLVFYNNWGLNPRFVAIKYVGTNYLHKNINFVFFIKKI